ncbi:hypothetical protein I4525_26090 [Klebsiella variicola]|uniref:hypothetical protein n=1 Tax=Klebsiella/Raoultella group TaxID=2890311 RepID=UPI000E58151C|nr:MULTISPECIES: hypothetical protein [Klebsiella/Raoultella group]MBG2046961.1 hypothetical protein [Klebsiella variicola]
MAQINIRLPDEVSEKAGEVLTPIGLTLNSYLQGIAHHMAETGQIPVVIRQQSVALKPEEVFLEAFIRYRTAYTHLHDIYEEQVSDTTPGGTERLTRCADEVSAALEFFKQHEKIIAAAPSQLEVLPGAGSETYTFARSPELFIPLTGYLRESIRRSGSQPHMEQALLRAVDTLNELQKMVSGEVSATTTAVFIIQDARTVMLCAEEATRKDQEYIVARAWVSRMKEAFQRADLAYLNLKADAKISAFSRIIILLRRLVEDAERYVSRMPEKGEKIASGLQEDLSHLLDTLEQSLS